MVRISAVVVAAVALSAHSALAAPVFRNVLEPRFVVRPESVTSGPPPSSRQPAPRPPTLAADSPPAYRHPVPPPATLAADVPRRGAYRMSISLDPPPSSGPPATPPTTLAADVPRAGAHNSANRLPGSLGPQDNAHPHSNVWRFRPPPSFNQFHDAAPGQRSAAQNPSQNSPASNTAPDPT